jgi:hypothetical protein
MSTDVFGGLREWIRLLEQLDHLKDSGQVDERQDGRAPPLTYRPNWPTRCVVSPACVRSRAGAAAS